MAMRAPIEKPTMSAAATPAEFIAASVSAAIIS